MSDHSELDRIISEGKVNPSTAMVVFAVELKAQGEKMDVLTKTINEDNQRYATRDQYGDLDKRIGRLEGAALKFLVTVFLAVLSVSGGVIIWALRQGAGG